jgi:hypothetical protein
VRDYLSMFSSSQFELDLNTQIDVLPSIEELNQLAGAFRKASFYISLTPEVYSTTTVDAVDIPQYIDKVGNVSFFVSDAQYKAFSQYSKHLIRTTDGWVISEIFQGFQACMSLAKKTFLEFMESPTSSGFKIILEQHPYYWRSLLEYFGLSDSILEVNRQFRSPDEYLIHMMHQG